MGVLAEPWVGWYEQGGTRKSVPKFALFVKDGANLFGRGIDVVGEWTLEGEIDDSQQMVLRKKYVDVGVKAQFSTYTGKRRVSGGREVIEGSWTDSKTADSGPFFFEKLHEDTVQRYNGYYEQNGSNHNITYAVLLITPQFQGEEDDEEGGEEGGDEGGDEDDNEEDDDEDDGDKDGDEDGDENSEDFLDVSGGGVDDLGGFTWTGDLDPISGNVTLNLYYLKKKNSIVYSGTKTVKDGKTVIEGSWRATGRGTRSGHGKFHLELDLPASATARKWEGWHDGYNQGGTQRRQTLTATLQADVTGTKLSGSGDDYDSGYGYRRAFQFEVENVGSEGVVLRITNYSTYSYISNTNPAKRFFKEGKEVIEGSTWYGSYLFRLELPVATPSCLRPPTGVPVSIRSMKNPNVYLRMEAGKVNLQVGRGSNERFELVLLEETGDGREQVYAIRSTLAKRSYLRLVPTELPKQAPAQGTALYPKGVGFAAPVKEVDKHSKFTVVVNQVEGIFCHALKLLDPGTAFDNKLFLRFDSDNLTGTGNGGEVNGQTYIGEFEKFLIEPFLLL